MKKYFFAILFSVLSFNVWALDYGIDRLSDPAIQQLLVGKNLAVLTHSAARSKSDKHLIDLLHGSFTVRKIFAPEHGLRTLADEWIEDGVDLATGLPVISLYKRGSKAPAPADLMNVETIVIDLQDVGVRYYTYFSTIAEVMKVAGTMGVEVIILDRPNLLGGLIMEGKVLDPTLAGGFTSYHTVPTRHGMTLGELALMINTEKNMGVNLTVVPVAGWQRENLLAQMDRPWIAPSPALIDIEQVNLYAMWGTLESFNLSVGRGTTNELAFQVIGAPWISGIESKRLAKALNDLGIKGLKFTQFTWDVTRATYVGKKANGVKLEWDDSEVRTDEFTYKISALLVKRYPTKIGVSQMSPASYGSKDMIGAIKSGMSWENYSLIIDAEIKEFAERRKPFLLY